MQKVPGQPTLTGSGLPVIVGKRVQVLVSPLIAVLFNVQSPYWFAIGHTGVFSLRRWSAWFHAGFHESGITLVPLEVLQLSPTGLSPALVRLSRLFG